MHTPQFQFLLVCQSLWAGPEPALQRTAAEIDVGNALNSNPTRLYNRLPVFLPRCGSRIQKSPMK